VTFHKDSVWWCPASMAAMFGARCMARAPTARVVATAASGGSRRRQMLGAMLLTAPLVSGPHAWALIPDDDDEEMVEKAKANRQNRLKEVRLLPARAVASRGWSVRRVHRCRGGSRAQGSHMPVMRLAMSHRSRTS
jgi:hypothetical protein